VRARIAGTSATPTYRLAVVPCTPTKDKPLQPATVEQSLADIALADSGQSSSKHDAFSSLNGRTASMSAEYKYTQVPRGEARFGKLRLK